MGAPGAQETVGVTEAEGNNSVSRSPPVSLTQTFPSVPGGLHFASDGSITATGGIYLMSFEVICLFFS